MKVKMMTRSGGRQGVKEDEAVAVVALSEDPEEGVEEVTASYK